MAPAGADADRRWPNVDRVLGRQPWAELRRVLQENQVPKVDSTMARLRRFVELLVQWNRSVSNLISKNDEERILAAHVIPSVEAYAWMKSRNLLNWCDLGSGGGFPALPLAICGLGERWDLVESRRTKTLFLQRAKAELGLKGVRVLLARIEDLITNLASAAPDRASRPAVRVPARSGPAATGPEADNGPDDGPGNRDAAWGDEGAESSVVGGGDELVGEAGDELGGETGDERAGEARGRPLGEAAEGSESLTDMPALEPPYDGFTSRATMTLAPTLRYASAIVRPGGAAFLWKGSRFSEEAGQATDWREFWDEGEHRTFSVEHSVVASFIRNSRK